MIPVWFFRRPVTAVSAALLLLGVTTMVASRRIRWRAQVVYLQVTGGIRDIGLGETIAYMMPGSDQSLEPLIETRNPYVVIRNFKTTRRDLDAGSRLFRSNDCVKCHGLDGGGGPGAPGLTGRTLKHGESDWAVYQTIRRGVANTAMTEHAIPDSGLWQLVTFIRSLGASKGSGASADGPDPIAVVNVPYADIAAVHEPSADWLTYSGSYSSTRHSALSQINPANVGRLALKWIHPFEGISRGIETSPIVRNGVMFVTTPAGHAAALDATTGKQIWAFAHKVPGDPEPGDFGKISNRGVAILDDRVFLGTVDGRMIALSAATGAVQWETALSSDQKMYFVSAAPLAYRDLVVTGVGTRRGGQGFIVAYDARTGKERWRFIAIPGPGEFGHDTWAGDSWREGGAPTWLTGSYLPEEDLLIWAIGNPKPDYDAGAREGDNLYSNSVVALRGSTGKLLWYFQFTPSDDHDWDANQIPVLVDPRNGSGRRLLWANRNGFFYIFDLLSGKYMSGTPFVQQTWTAGLDASGRPRPPAASSRNRAGSVQYPGNGGATNWWSPSFDADLNLMFVPTLEQGMVYFPTGGGWPTATGGQKFYTSVRALDASTGKRAWEYRREPRLEENHIGGLLSTKTGLLFGGDLSTFFALESRNGRLLWSVETGGDINAAPVTYAVNGQQFVVIAAGGNLLSFALPPARPPRVSVARR